MSITSENPKRGLAQYVEEQQEEQQRITHGSTQPKRYGGGVQKRKQVQEGR